MRFALSKETTMFKNYLKIAIRSLLRHKAYSLINIAGLAVGMACCMVLLLFIQHEFSYDRHHRHAQQIYRMHTRSVIFGREILWTYTQEAFAKVLKAEYPEVLYASHFDRSLNVDLKIKDELVKEQNFFWANQDILDIFTFEILRGNQAELLQNPNSVIITEKVAEKYFRDVDPVGQIIYMDTTLYHVTGVMKAQPPTSHFHANFIASYNTFPEEPEPEWFSFGTRTYFRLKEGVSGEAFARKMPDFIERHFGARAREFGYQYEYIPQPLRGIHLHSNIRGELEPNGNITYVYIMGIIAMFILFIACINFMNLSTARAGRRAREVGMRKVLGAYKKRLVSQFLGESLLISTMAFLLAFGALELILPYFNHLAGRTITLNLGNNLLIALAFLGVVLSVGLGAGLYPAFYLTKFTPVEVLKGEVNLRGSAALIRKSLVVSQFAISISLIIGAFIIIAQLDYLRSKDLGFADDNLVIVPLKTKQVTDSFEALKNELRSNPDIVSVTGGNSYPGSGYMTWDHWAEGYGDEEGISIDAGYVNLDYFETLQIPIFAGRAFAQAFSTDLENAVMINATAAKMLGFEDHAVGKKMYTAGPSDTSRTGREIIGVFQDYNAWSLRETIKPLILYPRYSRGGTNNLIARVNAANISETLHFIERKFQEVNPAAPFEFRFMDEVLAEYYRSEENLSAIINSFTILAILVACLGLLGLISFTAEQRTKEIGIRKVLGASVSNVVLLLSKEFALLVLLANIVAWPLAWYAMQGWLQGFAYRIDINWWMFALAGGSALLIALLTVSIQAIKAALANPVEALRYE
jgi:putative ABC transport system permease protein